jgi:hypothetical protein
LDVLSLEHGPLCFSNRMAVEPSKTTSPDATITAALWRAKFGDDEPSRWKYVPFWLWSLYTTTPFPHVTSKVPNGHTHEIVKPKLRETHCICARLRTMKA